MEGKLDVMVVELYDYDVVLDNKFFVKTCAIMMLHFGGSITSDPKHFAFTRGKYLN